LTVNASLALRAYLAFSHLAAPVYRLGLTLRLRRGKEHPQRYREKLGSTQLMRPEGDVIWLHGVGLGEVLALRSLIRSLAEKCNATFLVTSSTSTSASVFEKHCPSHTVHQFLPVDASGPIRRFLDHWRPSVSVWAEQDLWPALVYRTCERQIPLVLVNARMNEASYRSRARAASLYRNIYQCFAWISSQDKHTARHLKMLGAEVTVDGSLKAASIPLSDDLTKRIEFEQQTTQRHCWLLASSHAEDEQIALEAHRQQVQQHPGSLLIIAPRYIDRTRDIEAMCSAVGLRSSVRSNNDSPANCDVYIADTFGEMGLWYRVCACALIGGSHSAIEGHNPWEAAALGCAILHGPSTANFSVDYQSLDQNHAAVQINNTAQLLTLINDRNQLQLLSTNAQDLADRNNDRIDYIAERILSLTTLNQRPTADQK
jgi:3-deoxy-D-manno-octulosonic-acid transferase